VSLHLGRARPPAATPQTDKKHTILRVAVGALDGHNIVV
jgi:hypothetical protein